MYKVLVVDDQLTAQQMIANIIEKSEQFELFKIIDNASFAEMYCMADEVDLIIMDVYTYHGENGISASEKIKKNFPKIKIIIATSMAECSFLKKAKEAGCNSFWYKDAGDTKLIDIMERTMSNEDVWPTESPSVRIGDIQSEKFTDRELEVLREIVCGKPSKEICEDLHITKSTLDSHIKNMLRKTGCSSKMKLAVEVASKKLIIPDFW